ncbi:MAG: translation elongation factor Ts [Chloroflexota bacterium]
MAEVTAQMVKELRDKTGAGMADCKKALVESDGDMKTAIEYLRKKGAASAAKRADKSSNEGVIVAKSSADKKSAAIVEINCETDFVARNAQFTTYAETVAEALLNNDVASVDDLMKIAVDNDTIEGLHNEILAKFSERIEIRRFEKLRTEGSIGDYIHAGSKLAVLVEVDAPDLSEASFAKVRDIAMQVAAMNPQFVDRSQVNQETLDKEKEIYKQQAIEGGKKEDIAERIAQGKLEKFYTEQCLVEQPFVKDGAKTIADVLKEISQEAGREVKALSFRRYFLGESTED